MNKLEFKGKPVPKPRMTRADAWKKRPIVVSYFAFKDEINIQAKIQKFRLGNCIKVYFYVPMPKSWPEKKKKKMDGKPHKQKPDLDNYIKALCDTLLDEDSGVFYITATKKWARKGKIIVENLPEYLDY